MERLALLVLVLLVGCASGPYWVRTTEFGPKEVHIHDIGVSPWGASVQGWTVRDPVTGICHIFVTSSTHDRDCVVAHERRHCLGWDHPSYRYNLSCMQVTSLVGAYHGTGDWFR